MGSSGNAKLKEVIKWFPVAKKLVGIRHMPADLLKVLRENGVEINEDEIFMFF